MVCLPPCGTLNPLQESHTPPLTQPSPRFWIFVDHLLDYYLAWVDPHTLSTDPCFLGNRWTSRFSRMFTASPFSLFQGDNTHNISQIAATEEFRRPCLKTYLIVAF